MNNEVLRVIKFRDFYIISYDVFIFLLANGNRRVSNVIILFFFLIMLLYNTSYHCISVPYFITFTVGTVSE